VNRYTDSDAMLGLAALIAGLVILAACTIAAGVAYLLRMG